MGLFFSCQQLLCFTVHLYLNAVSFLWIAFCLYASLQIFFRRASFAAFVKYAFFWVELFANYFCALHQISPQFPALHSEIISKVPFYFATSTHFHQYLLRVWNVSGTFPPSCSQYFIFVFLHAFVFVFSHGFCCLLSPLYCFLHIRVRGGTPSHSTLPVHIPPRHSRGGVQPSVIVPAKGTKKRENNRNWRLLKFHYFGKALLKNAKMCLKRGSP